MASLSSRSRPSGANRVWAAVALSATLAVGAALPAHAEPTPPGPGTPTVQPRAAQALTQPTYDDRASAYTIPDVPGATYTVDGAAVAPGRHDVVFPQPERSARVTFSATAADGTRRTWKHQFPFVFTPEAPRYKDQDQMVFAPGQWGVHYVVIHNGQETKLTPSSWNDMSAYGADPLRFEARSNSPQGVLLTGQTSWEHTFAPRPDYAIDHGDEFNDAGVSKAWYVYNNRQQGKGRALADNVSVVTTDDGQGVLNLRARRHCVATDDEPLTDANATEDVCPAGTQTVYSGASMLSRYVHNTPKSIEVRAKMDTPHQGVTLAAWAHNEQQFCREEFPDTDIAEMDVLEVWGTRASIATTHMDCGPTGFPRYSVGIDKELPGQWHTWRVEYDGYAIRYYLDGELLTGDKGPAVTPESIGLTQDKFTHVMNDFNWQTLIGVKFPPNGSWAPFVDDTKPFAEQNDQIDYIRVEDFDPADCAPYGAIGSLAARRPDLGAPLSCESDTFTPGGRVQVFENGRVYWSAATGAHVVWGAIGDRYIALGGDRVLGLPTGGELTGLRDGGASQTFTGATMFWSPATGAHYAKGRILNKYASLGWETNPRMGYPITDEICGLRDGGCFQRFQRENTHIYWSPATGAHFTRGLIQRRYGELGWETGVYGFPVTDEICGLRDGGCFQAFQHENGHLYWSPASGAWNVQGRIFAHWASTGWETGRYGYPTGGETCRDVAGTWQCTSRFQHGTITWNARRGAW